MLLRIVGVWAAFLAIFDGALSRTETPRRCRVQFTGLYLRFTALAARLSAWRPAIVIAPAVTAAACPAPCSLRATGTLGRAGHAPHRAFPLTHSLLD